jgi:hypothetical protein
MSTAVRELRGVAARCVRRWRGHSLSGLRNGASTDEAIIVSVCVGRDAEAVLDSAQEVYPES